MNQGNARTVLERYRRFDGNVAQWYLFLCHGIREGLSLAVPYLWFIWQCIWTELQLCQTLCLISVKRGYELDRVLKECVSLGLRLPGCNAALGPAAVMLVSVIDPNRFVLAFCWHHWWQDLPPPFFIPYCEHRDPAPSPPCYAQGTDSSAGSAPDRLRWQRVLMLWQADLTRGLLLVTAEHSCCCGVWEETIGIASEQGA